MRHEPDPFRTGLLRDPTARIIIDSLRAANAALHALDPCCIDLVFKPFAPHLSETRADVAGGAMIALARRLRDAGGLETLPIGCRFVTNDEIIVLAAIAARQVPDDVVQRHVDRVFAARALDAAKHLVNALADALADAGLELGAVPVPLVPGGTDRIAPWRGWEPRRHGAALPRSCSGRTA